MHEDALVKEINFRFDFSRVLSDVLKLRWAKHMHQFKEGFQPSRETLMKENVKLSWAKGMYTFNAFHVVQVNPFTAVGPNKGGHFRASMEKKYGTERFDRLLERNAVKRILQPSCLAQLDDSDASRMTAFRSQTNQYWVNTWLDKLRVISRFRTVLERHIKCLAPFEKDREGVWVRTEMTPEAIVVAVVTVLRWVSEKTRAEERNVEEYKKLAEKIEGNLKAQNPDTFQTTKDKRDMTDAMKVCIHRENDEKRWAKEATEAAEAAEAARVAKKAAKAAKNTRGKRK